MKFRRHRRKSNWNWATRGLMALEDTGTEAGGAIAINSPDLLPSARVDWLLENGRGRQDLTVTGILLWLDFAVINSNAGIFQPAQLVDFYILKTYDDGTSFVPNLADPQRPYDKPAVPALVSSWDTSAGDENDGLDPYLWTHTIQPASSYRSFGTSNGFEPVISPPSTTTTNILNGSPLAIRIGWQPDVHVRTKRKLKKREGLSIGMTIPNCNNNALLYALSYSARVLTT